MILVCEKCYEAVTLLGLCMYSGEKQEAEKFREIINSCPKKCYKNFGLIK